MDLCKVCKEAIRKCAVNRCCINLTVTYNGCSSPYLGIGENIVIFLPSVTHVYFGSRSFYSVFEQPTCDSVHISTPLIVSRLLHNRLLVGLSLNRLVWQSVKGISEKVLM